MKKIGLLFCVLLVISVNNAFAGESANDYVSAIEEIVIKLNKKDLSGKRKVTLIKQLLENHTKLATMADKDKSIKSMKLSVEGLIAKKAGKALGKALVDDEISAINKQPILSLFVVLENRMYEGDLDVEPVIKELQRILVEGDDYLVREQCAVALALFAKHRKEASIALIAGLEKQLKETNPKLGNVRTTNIILNSIMKIRHKSAFIVLIQVLQSAYPPPTKIAAQKALDMILWD